MGTINTQNITNQLGYNARNYANTTEFVLNNQALLNDLRNLGYVGVIEIYDNYGHSLLGLHPYYYRLVSQITYGSYNTRNTQATITSDNKLHILN